MSASWIPKPGDWAVFIGTQDPPDGGPFLQIRAFSKQLYLAHDSYYYMLSELRLATLEEVTKAQLTTDLTGL